MLSIKFKPFFLLWRTLSHIRRRQLLALQLLSLFSAAGEVANLGAVMPFLQVLANPDVDPNDLGPLKTTLVNMPQQSLLICLGLGSAIIVTATSALRIITIRF